MQLQHEVFEIQIDYHQFYLWDSDSKPKAPEKYSAESTKQRILTGPNVVAILALRDGVIPVELEIHDAEPEYLPDTWDHIVEASLHLPTGHLQIVECIGGWAADFKVQADWYRVRSFFGGLNTIEDELHGDDYYKIVLWPAQPMDVVIVKQ